MPKSHNSTKKTLKDHVYLTLKDRILTQKLRPGDPLSELDLAQELKVSRTPVREALLRLQKDSLVDIIPNRGAHVTFISLKELKDTFQLLQILEGAVTRIAAEHINQEELTKLEKDFLSLKDKGHRITYEEEQKIGIKLHEIILFTSGNAKIVNLLRNIREQVRALSYASIKRPGRANEAIKEHLNIINALKKRNGPEAEEAMIHHLSNVYKTLLEFIG
jgi:DNA-binding GntR family transcriptional regulator